MSLESNSKAKLKNFFPEGADYCIEAGGSAKSIEIGFSLINPRTGILLFASHPPAGHTIALDPHELIAGKQIRGSWGGGFQPDTDVIKLSKLLCDNDAPLGGLVKDKFHLTDINKAINMFANREVFRPILVM